MKKFLIRTWLVWLVVLTLFSFFVALRYQYFFTYPRFQKLIRLGLENRFIWSWGGFDGVHYLDIAASGYATGLTEAFFPLFPLILSFFKWTGNLLISGLILNRFLSLIVVYLFYKLARLDYSKLVARKSLLLLFLFPTSFFLISLYNESLFLILILSSFLLARKQKWFSASLLAGLASATRLVGIFMFPALLFELYQQKKLKPRYILIISASLLGIGLYMLYLYQKFGDPFRFLTVQADFGASRSSTKLILLHQVFWRYLKMILTVDLRSILFYRVSLELLSGLATPIILFLSRKKIRLSYLIFGWLAYFTPTLTGTFSSLPRYVLVIFPIYFYLAKTLSKKSYLAWCLTSGLLLAASAFIFLSGHFIS
jgi:hypothetical protein